MLGLGILGNLLDLPLHLQTVKEKKCSSDHSVPLNKGKVAQISQYSPTISMLRFRLSNLFMLGLIEILHRRYWSSHKSVNCQQQK
jgi:hypothetical protein